MIPLAIVDDFREGIEFIFNQRESEAGTVQIGGLGEIGDLAGNHLLLSGVAVLVACLVAVPIGAWLGHRKKGEFLAVSVSNVGRAVPTLALIAFFIAFLGVGFANVCVALILLAIPPVLTNAYVGVSQVEPDTVDAARGMGLTDLQVLTKVELPLALSTIFGGIRTSSVNVVATATIAPYASVDTLGTPIISSNVYGTAGQLGAAIVVALITLACDAGLGGLQRAVTPKGVRVQQVAGGRSRRLRALFPSSTRKATTS